MPLFYTNSTKIIKLHIVSENFLMRAEFFLHYWQGTHPPDRGLLCISGELSQTYFQFMHLMKGARSFTLEVLHVYIKWIGHPQKDQYSGFLISMLNFQKYNLILSNPS